MDTQSEGIFVFNKPEGISSAGFLGQLKREWKIPRSVRVGHGGTLDPMASGVLVVGIGRSYTKQLHAMLTTKEKEYVVVMELGSESDTYDSTGIITPMGDAVAISDEDIAEAVREVAERTHQTPPAFSAIKIQGKPAYARARKGEQVIIDPKSVTVYEWEILNIVRDGGVVKVQVRLVVSAGFYVRSFVHDVGQLLNVGAYMTSLVRTRVGEYTLE